MYAINGRLLQDRIDLSSPQAKGLRALWDFRFDPIERIGRAVPTNTGTRADTDMGAGLAFNGSQDIYQAPPAAIGNATDTTQIVLVKFNSFPNAYNTVISVADAPNTAYRDLHVKSTGKLAIYCRTGGATFYDGTGTNTLSAGVWYQLALTCNSAGLVGYVNGEVDGTASSSGSLAAATGTQYLQIGNNRPNFATRFINGTVVWGRFYDRVLSAEEIKAVYQVADKLYLKPLSRRLWAPAATGGDASVTLTGAAGTTAAGTVSATGGATVTLTGASTTASAGTITASAVTTAAITGAGAASSAGTVEATGTAVVTLTGAAATGSAGTVSATADNTAIAEITGASATGSAGTISVAASSLIVLTGAQAIGYAGYVTATNGLVEDALVSGDDGDSGRYIGSKRHQADIERRNQRIIQITAALVASGVLQ